MWCECGMNDRNIVWIMTLIIVIDMIWYEYDINDVNYGNNVYYRWYVVNMVCNIHELWHGCGMNYEWMLCDGIWTQLLCMMTIDEFEVGVQG